MICCHLFIGIIFVINIGHSFGTVKVDQCDKDDVLFVKSRLGIELKSNGTDSYKTTKVTNTEPQCFLKCKIDDKCKSATYHLNERQCVVQDMNRFTIGCRIMLSPGVHLFEKRTCSTSFDSKVQFISVVKDAYDCQDVYEKGWKKDGVYGVQLPNENIFQPILCKMSILGGGWTVVQKRYDGSVAFNRTWNSYKSGFGDLKGEFWHGNDILHNMTRDTTNNQVLFILESAAGVVYYPFFDQFKIASEADDYKMTLGDYVHMMGPTLTNAAIEDFTYHSNMKFSTIDVQNTIQACADIGGGGGWWYRTCIRLNLNGEFGVDDNQAMKWTVITGSGIATKSLKSSMILVRKI